MNKRYQKNREKILLKQKEFYIINKDGIRKRRKELYQINKDAINKKRRVEYRNNPDVRKKQKENEVLCKMTVGTLLWEFYCGIDGLAWRKTSLSVCNDGITENSPYLITNFIPISDPTVLCKRVVGNW